MNKDNYEELDGINYSTLKKLNKHPQFLIKETNEDDIEPIYFTKGKYFEDVLELSKKELDEKYLILDNDINLPSDTMQKILNLIAQNGLPLDQTPAKIIVDACIFYEYGANNWKEETFVNKINLHKKFYDTLIDPRIKISYKDSEDAKIMAYNVKEKYPEFFTSTEDVEIVDQLVLSMEFNSINYKGKLDKVLFNHIEKTILPLDNKTTSMFLPTTDYSVNNFILTNRYDIQASLYTKLLQVNYPEYTILPFTFIVSSFNTPDFGPVLIEFTRESLLASYDGFEIDNKKYKGWKQLSSDLLWHYENQEFNFYREAVEAGFKFTF